MQIDVDAILEFGKATGIYDFMNSKWGWPVAESIHFVGLSLLVGSVWLFDFRLLGFGKSIAIAALHRFVPWGVFGYLLNVTTGVMFFVSAPDQYLYNPAFQLKVLCMLIAGVNVVVFYTTTSVRVKKQALEDSTPFAAKIIAVVSLAAWFGVICFGRLITFFRPPEHWCFWC